MIHFSDRKKLNTMAVLVKCFMTVPVVHAGLGLSVPQTDLHSSRDVDSEPTLELRARPQARLQVDDLVDQHMSKGEEQGMQNTSFKRKYLRDVPSQPCSQLNKIYCNLSAI